MTRPPPARLHKEPQSLRYRPVVQLAIGSPGNARGEGPKTVKGAQSDPNYVSRLLLGCVAHVCRGGGKNYSYATAVQANDRQATNCYFALSRVLRVHSDYLATGHTVADNFTECRTICDFLLLRESAVNLQRNNREGSSALETRFSERSAISVSK